jgi:nicotinate-nucleotide pyrophosphorylase (carboxylating)
MPPPSSSVAVANPYALPRRELAPGGFASWCTSSLGMTPQWVRGRLQAWLEEDHGGGCVSLWPGASGASERVATAVIVAKQEFVLSGLPLMLETFRLTSDGDVRLFSDLDDGVRVAKGDVVLAARASAGALLLAERVALNVASRLSGVSTLTARYVEELQKAASHVGCDAPTLLETRKTTPGLRVFEKYATRLGGARNHRHGLDGGAMLKENHLRTVGDIRVALRALKARAPILTKIEIEVSSLEEFEVALEEGADVIMLDNFKPAEVAQAVALRNAHRTEERLAHRTDVRLEMSGNLDTRAPADIVSSGVDYVSMGALVHKAPWVDMSLQLYVDTENANSGSVSSSSSRSPS